MVDARPASASWHLSVHMCNIYKRYPGFGFIFSCLFPSFLIFIFLNNFLCRNRFSSTLLSWSQCPAMRKRLQVLPLIFFPPYYRPNASTSESGKKVCFSKVIPGLASLSHLLLRKMLQVQLATTSVTDQGLCHTGNVPEFQTGKPK